MLFYGLITLLLGAALLGITAGLARWLHRRWGLPYALLTVGILTYIGALAVQFVALRALGGGWLDLLAVRAIVVGALTGFSQEIARLLGFQYLARTVHTRPQALMIGLGHGFVETAYTGLVAAGLGVSLLGYGAERPDDLNALLSGALAEALNGVLPLALHMALSWLVLQVFLRGEIAWLFAAIFLHTVSESVVVLSGPDAAWGVVVWRALVAALAIAILWRVYPPPAADAPPR